MRVPRFQLPPILRSTPRVERSPAELTSIEGLLRSAHEQFDDVQALHVLADRLCELNEPRGELMALQLARAPGDTPLPEEAALLEEYMKEWVPRGLDPDGSRVASWWRRAGSRPSTPRTSGVEIATRPTRDRVWVEVTASSITLHQRGSPERGEVILARQKMTAAGIDDPKVYLAPLK